MTDQTDYVKQPKAELKQNYDPVTSQRQDFHDQEAVQHKHLDKLSMRHSMMKISVYKNSVDRGRKNQN